MRFCKAAERAHVASTDDVADATVAAAVFAHRSSVYTVSKTRPEKKLPSRGKAIEPRHSDESEGERRDEKVRFLPDFFGPP